MRISVVWLFTSDLTSELMVCLESRLGLSYLVIAWERGTRESKQGLVRGSQHCCMLILLSIFHTYLPYFLLSKAAIARLSSSIFALILSISSSLTNFGPWIWINSQESFYDISGLDKNVIYSLKNTNHQNACFYCWKFFSALNIKTFFSIYCSIVLLWNREWYSPPLHGRYKIGNWLLCVHIHIRSVYIVIELYIIAIICTLHSLYNVKCSKTENRSKIRESWAVDSKVPTDCHKLHYYQLTSFSRKSIKLLEVFFKDKGWIISKVTKVHYKIQIAGKNCEYSIWNFLVEIVFTCSKICICCLFISSDLVPIPFKPEQQHYN